MNLINFKKIKLLNVSLGLLLMIGLLSFKENNISLKSLHFKDGFTVDEFYKKVDLDNGTLDEDGHAINFIFVKTTVKDGKYEIELTDGPNDLYEIKGTNIYVTFAGYFGYAGYGTNCIMKVSGNGYSATVYKIE